MKLCSTDAYSITSSLSAEEVIARLRDCTLIKHSLSSEKTNKAFIGKIGPESFELIDASSRIGLFCVLNGNLKTEQSIILTSRLHPTFQILFIVWIVVMLLLCLYSNYQKFIWSSALMQLLLFVISAFFFRLCLHFVYTISRDSVLSKIKKIIQ